MSKPSEKAMRLAKDILHDFGHHKCQEQDAIDAVASLVDAHTAEALEAQHRKTWALAMEAAADEVFGLYGYKNARDAIKALPCLPIEATKGK